jgi:hypothetical protein
MAGEEDLLTTQAIASKYPEAVAFAGVAASVWNGNTSPAKVEMAVTGRLHAALRQILDKDIQTVFLTDSGIRHIKKKHGSGEAARGQVDITPDDFALIPLVLNEFDRAEHDLTDKLGQKNCFSKRIAERWFTLPPLNGANIRRKYELSGKCAFQVPRADRCRPP